MDMDAAPSYNKPIPVKAKHSKSSQRWEKNKNRRLTTDLMTRGINVVDAEVVEQQRSSLRAKEQTLEARHI